MVPVLRVLAVDDYGNRAASGTSFEARLSPSPCPLATEQVCMLGLDKHAPLEEACVATLGPPPPQPPPTALRVA